MSDNLGPLDILCDAPPYPVVKACGDLGFHEPQDVRCADWTVAGSDARRCSRG